MQGPFKPLLPLHFTWPTLRELSALEALVELHLKCGVRHVIVVSGQREHESIALVVDKLQKQIKDKQKISLVQNPNAARGMFSSVEEGLRALVLYAANSTHFFVQPADIPLIRTCTIQSLLQAKDVHPDTALIPAFKGKTGHPPLIPRGFVDFILGHGAEQGLRGALQNLPQKTIATADCHILFDVDNVHDYEILQQKILRHHLLQPEEALELLYCLNTSPQGVQHAQSVALVAEAFAKAYNQNQQNLIDPELAKTGALLHDMCKHEQRHEQAAGKLLRELGLAALAPLVEEHNDCQLDESAPVTEKELIYLADKYVYGQNIIPIQQRFEQKLNFYAHIPEACTAIKARLKRAKAMEARVSAELGQATFELAKQASNVCSK